MRLFLDTNVLVSAFTTRGLGADLLRLVPAEHELLSGEIILQDLRHVLDERFRVPRPITGDIFELLRNQAVVVAKPDSPASAGVRDADDEWVFAAALAGRADVLITGDKALLLARSETRCRHADSRSAEFLAVPEEDLS
ncbi:MAG: putative toxin-antitoxin system toxin component, PIN family [Gammaproteobacteria bacterium]